MDLMSVKALPENALTLEELESLAYLAAHVRYARACACPAATFWSKHEARSFGSTGSAARGACRELDRPASDERSLLLRPHSTVSASET